MPSLVYNLSRCQEHRGDYCAAEAGYRKVLEQCPDYVACLLRLGYMLLTRGHKEPAEALFKEAAAKPEGHQDAIAILCMLWQRSKQWGRAQVRLKPRFLGCAQGFRAAHLGVPVCCLLAC
jgi:tetratricopeptide (TPR) repeat protein